MVEKLWRVCTYHVAKKSTTTTSMSLIAASNSSSEVTLRTGMMELTSAVRMGLCVCKVWNAKG